MGIIKDGKVYRTEYEQIVHLTKEHLKQVKINENISKEINELGISSNFGGYNYVRFAFIKIPENTYYKFSEKSLSFNELTNSGWEDGDYIEINSNVEDDIPAYGYFKSPNIIEFGEKGQGDYIADYGSLSFLNVTKSSKEGREVSLEVSVMSEILEQFGGTSLLDYNPQSVKKQLFNVLNDVAYNRKTQYVSFDLNRDDIYNFVFVGVVSGGENGRSIRSVNQENLDIVLQISQAGDNLLFVEDFENPLPGGYTPKIGDVCIFRNSSLVDFAGNIRGEKGEKGQDGTQGPQGERGVQGEQGIQGIQGIQGQNGENSPALKIMDWLENSSYIPSYASAEVGDAYVVTNTNEPTIKYDLWFKTALGSDWYVLPNWGPIKGDTGPQGVQGLQGIQGVIGPQGPQGLPGINGQLYEHSIRILATVNGEFVQFFILYYSTNPNQYTSINELDAFTNNNQVMGVIEQTANADLRNTILGRIVFFVNHVPGIIYITPVLDVFLNISDISSFTDNVRVIK